MCEPVLENKEIFSRFETRVISISYSADVKSTGAPKPAKIGAFLRYFFATLKELIFFRPDTAYFVPSLSGAPFLRDLLFILAARIAGVRAIFHIHGMGLKRSAGRSPLFRELYRLAFNGSELIILSELLRGEIDFLTPVKIHILPNGIANTSLPEKNRDQFPVKLLFVSNFYSYKGVIALIDLLAEVKSTGRKFACKIIGEEKDITYNELQSLITNNNLTNEVQCPGSLSGNALYQLYAYSDILIYPTQKDAMPLVILEAMRAGMAILANPVGAIPEMLGLTEQLYPTPQNLITLLDNPEQIIQLGERNRKLFEKKYTLDKFQNTLLEILQ